MHFPLVSLFLLSSSSSLLLVQSADDACADKDSVKCAGWAKNGFCTNCFYKCSDRISFCAKTCGYCGTDVDKCKECSVTTTTAPPTTAPCFDAVSSCTAWQTNHTFCDNGWYKCEDKKKWCPKTCGLCADDACK